MSGFLLVLATIVLWSLSFWCFRRWWEKWEDKYYESLNATGNSPELWVEITHILLKVLWQLGITVIAAVVIYLKWRSISLN